MAQNGLIQVRVDETLKKEADELFTDLGLDTPTAIRIFLKQSLRQHGLPFQVNQLIPNEETISAMKEADEIIKNPDVKGFTNIDELFKELDL